MNHITLMLFYLLVLVISEPLAWSRDKKNPTPPSLETAPFNVESSGEAPMRDPASQTSGQDLLGDLERLLDDPSQRDAKEQLGISETIQPTPLVEPLPKLTIKDKAPNPEPIQNQPVMLPQLSKKESLPVKAKKSRSQMNEVLSVGFVPKTSGYELTLKMSDEPTYRTLSNPKKKQFTFIFNRTLVSKKLRRSYDTGEFDTSVQNYSLTQAGKGKSVRTQLVLQMRSMTAPRVSVSGNSFKLEFIKPGSPQLDRVVASDLPESSVDQDFFSSGRVFNGAPLEKLELKNTDIREAIRLVVRSSGYNVVIGEDVKGNIGSLSLENIPWDQAFFLILQSKRLGFIRQGNIVRIATLETLKTEKEEMEKQEDVEPLRTVLIPISYAKAADLSPRAQSFLSKRGKVDTDERSNTIIVRDIAKVIERLQKLFVVLDTQPPAVSISAKFVEVKKTFLKTLGLGSFSMGSQTSGLNLGFQSPTFAGQGGSGTINLSAPRFAALNASLSIGESDNLVKVLANPTITVQQGQKGSILQGKTTEVPQAVATVGVATTALTQTANLSLDVTPIVANDGSISLDTRLLQEIPLQVTGALAKDTRSVKTQIILQNGDTAVLGGVIASQEEKGNSGVPFLRNIPLLGLLFSQQKERVDQNEVLIFITGRILNPDSAFKQNI